MAVIIRGKNNTRGQDALPRVKVGPLRRSILGVFSGKAYRYFEIGPEGARINPDWLGPRHAPDAFGRLPFRDSESEEPKDGMVKIIYNYEGVTSEASIVETPDFTITVAPQALAIQQHPRFAQLEKLWGKFDDEKESFPKYLKKSAAPADDVPEAEATASGAIVSPGFGLSQFYAFNIVIGMRKLLKTSTKATLRSIGQLDTPPAAALADIDVPPGGNWLVTHGQVHRRGNLENYVRELELEWTHGWPRPWPSLIYRKRA